MVICQIKCNTECKCYMLNTSLGVLKWGCYKIFRNAASRDKKSIIGTTSLDRQVVFLMLLFLFVG